MSGTEIAGGVAAPWIAGQAPNFYDWTMGQLESDPAAQEKVQRARDNILSLGPIERALIEGGSASGLGAWLGGGRRDFGATKSRAQGVLDTFEGRRAAEAAAAKAKEEKAALARGNRGRKPVLVPPPRDPLAIQNPMSPEGEFSMLSVGGA
jgi:hypothetical protein